MALAEFTHLVRYDDWNILRNDFSPWFNKIKNKNKFKKIKKYHAFLNIPFIVFGKKIISDLMNEYMANEC